MFIVKALAHKEKPIEHLSDLYRVLDEKLIPKLDSLNLSEAGVGFVKQHSYELFKSYFDFGLFRNESLVKNVPQFMNDYLTDRFNVPKAIAERVTVIPRLRPENWIKT